MALSLFNCEISELCLGKRELPWISATASISDALAALKASGDTRVSVWVCDGDCTTGSCICVGKFSIADVILFLCREENLADPFKAFEAPVSEVLPKAAVPVVRHLEAKSSLLEAIDCILDGTQYLVIPIENHQPTNPRKQFINRQQLSDCNCHSGHPHCWLTPEDVSRYLFNSIWSFSPIPSLTIKSLDVINRDILTLPYNRPASSAFGLLSHALTKQESVAVVDNENRIIGEISPYALTSCDETAAGAIMVLSALDLMAYLEYSNPPEALAQMVRMKLEDRKLMGMVDLMDDLFQSSASASSSCCSSDDESLSIGNVRASRNNSWGRHYPARKSDAVIVCSPESSLVAVMLQALSNRVPAVWVVDEDQTVVGAVTLSGILQVLRNVAAGSA